MSDEELVKRLRNKRQKGNRFDSLEYEAADRIEALTDQLEAARHDAKEAEAYADELAKENERIRRTIGAAGKLGRIIGFLGDDEERIAVFLEACGPELINRARATLAKIEGDKT